MNFVILLFTFSHIFFFYFHFLLFLSVFKEKTYISTSVLSRNSFSSSISVLIAYINNTSNYNHLSLQYLVCQLFITHALQTLVPVACCFFLACFVLSFKSHLNSQNDSLHLLCHFQPHRAKGSTKYNVFQNNNHITTFTRFNTTPSSVSRKTWYKTVRWIKVSTKNHISGRHGNRSSGRSLTPIRVGTRITRQVNTRGYTSKDIIKAEPINRRFFCFQYSNLQIKQFKTLR